MPFKCVTWQKWRVKCSIIESAGDVEGFEKVIVGGEGVDAGEEGDGGESPYTGK